MVLAFYLWQHSFLCSHALAIPIYINCMLGIIVISWKWEWSLSVPGFMWPPTELSVSTGLDCADWIVQGIPTCPMQNLLYACPFQSGCGLLKRRSQYKEQHWWMMKREQLWPVLWLRARWQDSKAEELGWALPSSENVLWAIMPLQGEAWVFGRDFPSWRQVSC